MPSIFPSVRSHLPTSLPSSQPFRPLFPWGGPPCRRARGQGWRSRRRRRGRREHRLSAGAAAVPAPSARRADGTVHTAPSSAATCTPTGGKDFSPTRRPALADAPAARTVVAGSGGQSTPAVTAAAAAALPVRTDAVGAKAVGAARAPRGATASVASGGWDVSAPTRGSAAK